jgi:hypothetical protein
LRERRVSTSVFARHYFTPKLEYRDKVLLALHELLGYRGLNVLLESEQYNPFKKKLNEIDVIGGKDSIIKVHSAWDK